MQLLFQVQIAASAVEANQLLEKLLQSRSSANLRFAVSIIAFQLVAILAYWLASKIVAKDEARFSNALKTWCLYIGWFVGLAVVAAIFIAAGVWQQLPALGMIGVVLSSLLMLLARFKVPMKVYAIGFGRAFLFVLLSLVISLAGQLGVAVLLDRSSFVKTYQLAGRIVAMSAAERRSFGETFRRRLTEVSGSKMGSDATIAADRGRSLPERRAALQRIYDDLQQRHRTFQPTDLKGRQIYRADKVRYEFLVKQLETDAFAAAPR